MKNIILFFICTISVTFAQKFTTHFCFGYTPIFGIDMGALTENNIPKLENIKLTNRITLGYMLPINSNVYLHTITATCQVGIKLTLLENKLNPGTGLTFNAFMPYNHITEQMESLFVAYGFYISLSTKTHGIEPAIILSIIKPNDSYEYDTSIGLITIMLSKQF